VDQQLANNPGGARFAQLLDRAINMSSGRRSVPRTPRRGCGGEPRQQTVLDRQGQIPVEQRLQFGPNPAGAVGQGEGQPVLEG